MWEADGNATAWVSVTHSVRLVTLVTTSHPPPELMPPSEMSFDLVVLRRRGLTNHAFVRAFAEDLHSWRRGQEVDAVIGFNRMCGLDVLYAVDLPWPHHNGFRALLPRYRTYMELERSVFCGEQSSYIFFISSLLAEDYQRRYDLASHRYEVLTPMLRPDLTVPEQFYQSRAELRAELQIPPDHALLINVAIYDRQKGTDRAVEALTSVPNTILLRCPIEPISTRGTRPICSV